MKVSHETFLAQKIVLSPDYDHTLYLDSDPSGSMSDIVLTSHHDSRPPLVTLGWGGPGFLKGTLYDLMHLVCWEPNRDVDDVCITCEMVVINQL